MRGFVIAEAGHVVQAVPPKNIAGGVTTSPSWSMSKYGHASILLFLGVTGAAATVTVEACTNAAGAGAEAIPFAVYKQETANGDVLGDRVEVLAAGFSSSTEDNVFYAIEVDAAELPAGKSYLRLRISDPGTATFAAATVVLTGARYAGVSSPTVLV